MIVLIPIAMVIIIVVAFIPTGDSATKHEAAIERRVRRDGELRRAERLLIDKLGAVPTARQLWTFSEPEFADLDEETA